MRAIHFNPVNDSLDVRNVDTEFKVIQEFYFKTDKGPLIRGEIFKDTPKNRELIEKIIALKVERKRIYEEMTTQIYQELNKKRILMLNLKKATILFESEMKDNRALLRMIDDALKRHHPTYKNVKIILIEIESKEKE